MRKHVSRMSLLAGLLLAAIAAPAATDHTNAFTGTWKLNVAKSKFDPGPPPQSVTVTLAPDGTFTVDEIDSKGNPVHLSHPWSGGKEVPMQGIPNATDVTRIHGREMDDTMKQAGKVVQTVHVVVAPDGKTSTATIHSNIPNEPERHDLEFYEKQ